MLTYAIKEGEVGRKDKMRAEEGGNAMKEREECPKCLIIVSRMERKVKANVTDLLARNDEDGASVGVRKRKTSLTYLNRLVVAQAQLPH